MTRTRVASVEDQSSVDYRREETTDEQLFLIKHLTLELKLWQAECDFVIRPLIVEGSNHGQRNNERADNCCSEGFHQAYSRLSFFKRLACAIAGAVGN